MEEKDKEREEKKEEMVKKEEEREKKEWEYMQDHLQDQHWSYERKRKEGCKG